MPALAEFLTDDKHRRYKKRGQALLALLQNANEGRP
jgi:hypothetical protein